MFPERFINCDFAVIGGGMAGICTAISASRRGVKVCLIHNRPVLGGNASSEIRMWIRGASDHFPYYKESGILEEIALDNAYYNPDMTYPLWDMVLYNKVRAESNVTLLLNTVCTEAESKDGKISRVGAFCMTDYTKIYVSAKYFADCSGDSVLADLTGAEYTSGREGSDKFGESLRNADADSFTMGNSLLIQAIETDEPVSFTPPPFAKRPSEEEFRYRLNLDKRTGFIDNNYWWIEAGGDKDTLHGAEAVNRELLATVYGIWDFVKNSGKFDSEKWDLHFVGALPAKRETRRYIGDYVLTQNDVDSATRFDDEVAYGGWTMDDHSPFGFRNGEKPNVFHPIKAPYPIPWRCLYSRNVSNLAFAGRNISASHLALSSTRVMATCAMLGQAVGTAVSLAVKYDLSFRELLPYADELKQALRDDDCYLLHTKRKPRLSSVNAKTNAGKDNEKILFDGEERELSDADRPAVFPLHKPLEFTFEKTFVKKIRILFDSDLPSKERTDTQIKMYPLRCHVPKNREKVGTPSVLIKKYTLSVLTEKGWKTIRSEQNNFSRLVFTDVNEEIGGIRLVGDECRKGDSLRLFSLDVIV